MASSKKTNTKTENKAEFEEQVESVQAEQVETTEVAEEPVADEINVEQQLAELNDKHLRLHAEFDNFRRRTLKEKTDLIKSGGERTLVELLPVIDDMDRALEAIERAQDVEAIKEGLSLIITKFQNFLKSSGVQEIVAKEQDFDTDKHEAITKIPAPTPELKGKVVDVIQKGYQLHEKVIRFSKVVVGE